MPPFLIPAFLRSVPRWAWFVAAGALLILGLLIWHNSRVSEAVDSAFSDQRADVTERTLEAERQANANAEQRRQVREDANRALSDAREDAIKENPNEASKPAGPAVRSVLQRLRTEADGDKRSAD